MKDYHEEERKQFLRLIDPGVRYESAWWWAIGIVFLALLVILVPTVGPVVFPAG